MPNCYWCPMGCGKCVWLTHMKPHIFRCEKCCRKFSSADLKKIQKIRK